MKSWAKEILIQCEIIERGLNNDEQSTEKSGDEGTE